MSRSSVFSLGVLSLAVAGLAAPAQGAPPTKAPPPARATAPKPRPTPTPVLPRVLEGTVKGPTGKPVADARVLYQRQNPAYRETTPFTRTDATGHFRVELKDDGLLTVRIEASGLAARTLEKVRPGTPLVVTLDRGGAIGGVVLDEAGRPVAKARVTAAPEQGLATSLWEATEAQLGATTDVRGRFRLEGVAPGLYTVTATARGLGTASQPNAAAGAMVKLLLRTGGFVTGSVVDSDRRPVEGVLVRAEMEERAWKASRVERTDQQGRFELLGLDPGSYTVVAHRAGFAPSLATAVRVQGEGASEVSLTLLPGSPVIGRLVGPEERPASGRVFMQEVGGQSLPSSLSDLLHAEADAQGQFRIECVPAGSWVLAVMAPGFAGQRVDAEVSPKEALVDLGDIVLDRGLTISGRVHTASDAPVADAVISAFATGAFRASRAAARSGPDGTFVLAGLSPTAYRLFLNAPGFAGLRTEVVAPAEGIDLTFGAAGSITGQVVDESGHPLSSYRTSVHNIREADDWGGMGESTATIDGRFVVEDLKEGVYVLRVTAPERAPGSASDVKVVAGRTTDVGTLRLRPGGTVRGLVVDGTGAAVSTATVRVFGPGLDAFDDEDRLRSTTDATGAFEIRGVGAGAQSVLAEHPGYARGETRVDVDPDRGPAEARITLHQSGRIEGSARKRDGTPLTGATVRAYLSTGRDYPTETPECVTRADGAFTLEHLPPGPTSVALLVPVATGRASSSVRQADVREGETTSVEFVLREILVTGRITRARAPLASAALRLLGRGGMSISSSGGSVPVSGPQRQQAITGDDGSFELIVDEPGKYRAQVQSADGRMRFPVREVEIPDVEAHVLELAFSGSSMSGVVVDKESGAPVVRASVWATSREGTRPGAGGRTAEDGRFDIEIEPGAYDVTARAERYGSARTEVQVDTSGTPDVRFELVSGLGIRGRIQDAAGRPVSGLQVAATLEEDRRSEYATSLADGTFQFDNLVAGRWNLACGNRLAGYGVRASVVAGEQDVAVTLRRGGVVHLLILEDGAPRAGAWAAVERVSGAAVSIPDDEGYGATGATGQMEMGVPPGAIEIQVRGDTHKGTVRVNVADGGTARAEVRLTEPIGPNR